MKKLVLVAAIVLLCAGCIPNFPTSSNTSPPGGCTSATTGSSQNAWSGVYGPNTPSNGSNTYVDNEGSSIQTGSSMTTCAGNDPSDVGTQADITNTSACGGCVQVYPHVKQLWTDYDTGSNPATWGKTGTETGTPPSVLQSLTSTFNIGVTDNSANQEWAYDIWPENNTGTEGGHDLMIWVNTTSSRNTGGATVDGQFNIYLNGTATPAVWMHFGSEKIVMFGTYNSTTGVVTPAQYISGTVDILYVIHVAEYLGYWSASANISQVNFGLEICDTGGNTDSFQQYNLSEIAQ